MNVDERSVLIEIVNIQCVCLSVCVATGRGRILRSTGRQAHGQVHPGCRPTI